MSLFNKEEQKQFDSLCYQIFNTPTGKELMKYLNMIKNLPVADPSKGSSSAYFREGQNDMIRILRTSVKNHIINARGPDNESKRTIDTNA